jgi:hypothetical protein
VTRRYSNDHEYLHASGSQRIARGKQQSRALWCCLPNRLTLMAPCGPLEKLQTIALDEMTHETATLLRNYLQNHWRENPLDLLFPNRNDRPMKRAYVVKFGLKPILRELGLPTKSVGLHAFRHGIATELARIISLVDVQKVMRHADIKSTLKYIHTDKAVQRKALETLQWVQFSD